MQSAEMIIHCLFKITPVQRWCVAFDMDTANKNLSAGTSGLDLNGKAVATIDFPTNVAHTQNKIHFNSAIEENWIGNTVVKNEAFNTWTQFFKLEGCQQVRILADNVEND